MRHRDDGDALGLDALELREDRLPRLGVEVPRRLVREQHGGLVDQRAGDGDALLLPARELARLVVEPVAEPEPREQVRRPVARVAGVERGRHRDVLDRGQRRQEVEVLEDEPDRLLARPRPLRDREVRHVGSVEEAPARGRVVEQPEHVQQRRLPGAAGADDRDELAGPDREVDVVERDDRLAAAARVALVHPSKRDAVVVARGGVRAARVGARLVSDGRRGRVVRGLRAESGVPAHGADPSRRRAVEPPTRPVLTATPTAPARPSSANPLATAPAAPTPPTPIRPSAPPPASSSSGSGAATVSVSVYRTPRSV
ncbi:GDSL-like lipase/acylhydrolase domain-containing protein [Halorubrum distributum JCM 13916]|uniref:GDSL-like lipase/acylhydrolase domain-containing protein n=1 Tax=Halorubrum distributum JCM 13916 TaxID=1230455 RepID=M0PEK2_9EURY|nr:GDSL-like lipase/acylhydrolase domain-containing protein [Halorubrum arcis JCM 13916]